jgi:hypothetical protein
LARKQRDEAMEESARLRRKLEQWQAAEAERKLDAKATAPAETPIKQQQQWVAKAMEAESTEETSQYRTPHGGPAPSSKQSRKTSTRLSVFKSTRLSVFKLWKRGGGTRGRQSEPSVPTSHTADSAPEPLSFREPVSMPDGAYGQVSSHVL